MGKDKTQSSGVDNVTGGRQQDAWMGAQAYARQGAPGIDPAVQQAQKYDTGVSQQGQVGMNALSGDANALHQLSNPYQQQVIDATNAQWGRQAANVQNSVASQFSKSGAFGGTRQGVATGVGLGEVANNQMQQIAGLNYSGYQNAMQQAGQLANLGMGANTQNAQLGQYNQQNGQNQAQTKAQSLVDAAHGLVHGQTQTQKGDLLGDVMGVAKLGMSFIPGVGSMMGGGGGQSGNIGLANSPFAWAGPQQVPLGGG